LSAAVVTEATRPAPSYRVSVQIGVPPLQNGSEVRNGRPWGSFSFSTITQPPVPQSPVLVVAYVNPLPSNHSSFHTERPPSTSLRSRLRWPFGSP
jgi:hypothetical protein